MLFLNVTHILKQIHVTEKGFIYSCSDTIAPVWLRVCVNVKYLSVSLKATTFGWKNVWEEKKKILEPVSTQTSGPNVSTATQSIYSYTVCSSQLCFGFCVQHLEILNGNDIIRLRWSHRFLNQAMCTPKNKISASRCRWCAFKKWAHNNLQDPTRWILTMLPLASSHKLDSSMSLFGVYLFVKLEKQLHETLTTRFVTIFSALWTFSSLWRRIKMQRNYSTEKWTKNLFLSLFPLVLSNLNALGKRQSADCHILTLLSFWSVCFGDKVWNRLEPLAVFS